jgi:LysR family cys regulon transcriptional activator
MNLRQLRYLCEIERLNLNLSAAAGVLFTSQPGISKQVRLLEEELGVKIFVRHGKRLVAVTEPGKAILGIAHRMLHDAANITRVSEEFRSEDRGSLSIATTHTQARYALPRPIKVFTKRYPGVRLSLHQCSPTQISEMTTAGATDIAIATEAIEYYSDLVMLPCYDWNYSVITPPGHPLLKARKLTLEAIARYPIVTYDFAFTGRSKISDAFAAKNLTPNVVLTAIDTDVIKTYVELGLGVGILASMAYDRRGDQGLRAIDAGHLFEKSTTRIGLRRNYYLRSYVYEFIELFAPHLTRKVVDTAMAVRI